MKSSRHDSGIIVDDDARCKRAKHSHEEVEDSESSSNSGSQTPSSAPNRTSFRSPRAMSPAQQSGSTSAMIDALHLLQVQGALNLSGLQQPRYSLPATRNENVGDLFRAALALEVERKRTLSDQRTASTLSNLQELLTLSQLARTPAPTIADPLLRSLLSSPEQGVTDATLRQLSALMQAQQSLSAATSVDILLRLSPNPLSSSLNGLAIGSLAGLPSDTTTQSRTIDQLIASRLAKSPQLSALEAQLAAARGASMSTISASLPPALGEYLRQTVPLQTGSSTSTPAADRLLSERELLLGKSLSSVPETTLRQKDPAPAHLALEQQQQLIPTSQGNRGLRATTRAIDERVPFPLCGILPPYRNETLSVTHTRQDDTTKTPSVSYEGDRLVPMALPAEQFVMSEYQYLLRQQIVFVAAKACDNEGKTQGRNKPIVQGQVGILCKYCARLPRRQRPRGAAYYPAMLHRIYQAAQNMSHNHFMGSCRVLPEEIRQKLMALKDQKVVTIGAGKEYWLSAAMTVGVREGESGLHFCKEK